MTIIVDQDLNSNLHEILVHAEFERSGHNKLENVIYALRQSQTVSDKKSSRNSWTIFGMAAVAMILTSATLSFGHGVYWKSFFGSSPSNLVILYNQSLATPIISTAPAKPETFAAAYTKRIISAHLNTAINSSAQYFFSTVTSMSVTNDNLVINGPPISKVSVLGAPLALGLTKEPVVFQGDKGLGSDTASFFWDDNNKRLAIIDTPDSTLALNVSGQVQIYNRTSARENYSTTEFMEVGDVAVSSSYYNKRIAKSSGSYEAGLVGIVFATSGTTFDGQNVGDAALAVAGRAPVKVTTENGAIQPGDFLTSSELFPGYAMKAVRSGRVIGQAVEGFSSSVPNDSGKILAIVKVGYQNVNNTIALEAPQDVDPTSQSTVQGSNSQAATLAASPSSAAFVVDQINSPAVITVGDQFIRSGLPPVRSSPAPNNNTVTATGSNPSLGT